MNLGDKIAVVGSSGSGKSTLSIILSKKLNLPLIHLDQHFWKPNWVATEQEEWIKVQTELIKYDKWIMDGDYSGTMEVRFEVCNTIIFLDVNRFACIYRVIRRRLFEKRPDAAIGCPDKIDFDFIKWIWNYPKKNKPHTTGLLKKYKDKQIIILRGIRQIKKFTVGMTK